MTTPAGASTIVRPPGHPPRPDRLVEGVQELVALINQKKNDPKIYRKLVRLGGKHRHDLRGFRRSLIAAGLPESRASEIHVILKCESIADNFAGDRLSFREALRAARIKPAAGQDQTTKRQSPTGSVDQREPASLAICRAMDVLLAQAAAETARHPEVPCWPMEVGIYRLMFRPKEEDGAVTTS